MIPANPTADLRGLLLTGGGGAGKTTVAQAIGRILTSRNLPTAVVDLDALAQFGPNTGSAIYDQLRSRNLAAVWTNYRDAGAQHVIVSGAIDNPTQRDLYADCLTGCDVQVARLVTTLDLVVERTTGTTRGPQWNLQNALDSHQRIADAALEDFTVTNNGEPADAAQEVLTRAGWL
jgi:GTPase SAR1 family protein